jgi:hypothetical protein
VAIGPHYLTFGQVFLPGAVPAGSQLAAQIGGLSVAVQMDVDTSHPDGSVLFAVLTLLQPALAANASVDGMLSLSTAAAASPPVSISAANPGVQVALTLHNADGTTTPCKFDVGALLQAAFAAGTATIERQGPQVTEASFTAPIGGSFYLTFDVSAFADGSTATDVSFNNDIAMSPNGGTVTYDFMITRNGAVVLQQVGIEQIQYTTWHRKVTSNGAPQAQVVHDIAYLARTGAIPNYDTTQGIDAGLITTYGARLGGPTYGILGSASVTQYMGMTGGRDDIGPQPAWNAIWLMTQDPTAEAYALAQADAAGSVPWHFVDGEPGADFVTVTKYPDLWTDPRGNPTLTQPVYTSGSTQEGWTSDTAHQPDLSYVAYLLTGDRAYLDQLTAQAAWCEVACWPAYRLSGQGLVANGQDQVRMQAWSLRQVQEAAFANADGSTMKAYFTGLAKANWAWLVSQIPAWTEAQGEAHGYLPGNYGGETEISIAPWEQDYFVSTAVQAAGMGYADAVTFLGWMENFIVGRFLQGANGFQPQNGIVYNLTVGSSTGPLPTWAAIEAASEAAGQTNGTGWAQSDGDYGQLALQSLAGIISVTGSADARKAHAWLLASGAPQLHTDPQFDIVPRQ